VFHGFLFTVTGYGASVCFADVESITHKLPSGLTSQEIYFY
jgi:hypothetical protein